MVIPADIFENNNPELDNSSLPKNIISNWETEECFEDPDNIFKAIYKDIDAAQKSILVEMFILSLDNSGLKFIQELKKAAQRGISVKLVVDGIGSPAFNAKIIKDLKQEKIDVRIYKPIPRFFNVLAGDLIKGHWSKIGDLFVKMNRRNHRKIILIDERISWVGSANISDEYLSWRETMVRVTGSGVKDVFKGFTWVWDCATNGDKKNLLKQNFITDRVCHSFTWFNSYKVSRFKIKLLNKAKNEIRVINPYFIPPYRLLIPLLKAQKRGVKVTLLTSKLTDVFFVRWFARSYYQLLIRKGIKVYEMEKKFLHSKIMIIDHQAVIGTSNYNYRSFRWDLEIDLLVDKPQTLIQLNKRYYEDLKQSKEVPKIKFSYLWTKFLKWLNPLKKIS